MVRELALATLLLKSAAPHSSANAEKNTAGARHAARGKNLAWLTVNPLDDRVIAPRDAAAAATYRGICGSRGEGSATPYGPFARLPLSIEAAESGTPASRRATGLLFLAVDALLRDAQ